MFNILKIIFCRSNSNELYTFLPNKECGYAILWKYRFMIVGIYMFWIVFVHLHLLFAACTVCVRLIKFRFRVFYTIPENNRFRNKTYIEFFNSTGEINW